MGRDPDEGSAGGSIRVGLDGRIHASVTMGIESQLALPSTMIFGAGKPADADVEGCPPRFEDLSLFAQTTTSHLDATLRISAAPD